MNGLVLEGGGAKGAYHVGAMQALKKCDIKINVAVGTSIGSVNAAFFAQNSLDILYKLWTSFDTKDIIDIDNDKLNLLFKQKQFTKETIQYFFSKIKEIIGNKGIKTEKMKELLLQYFDEEALRKSKIDFGLVTYNWSDKKTVEIFKKDIPFGKISEYILASCYLPVFKFEKIIDNKYYLDGGFINACPISMLMNRDLDTIYVVRTNALGFSKKVKSSKAKIITIKSNEKLGPVLQFDRDSIDYNIKLGYYDTIKVIDNLFGDSYYFYQQNKKYLENMIKLIPIVKLKELAPLINIKYGNRKQFIELLLFKVKRKLKIRSDDYATIIIKAIEYCLNNLEYERFQIYNINRIIAKLKRNLKHKDKTDIVYLFILNLKTTII